MTTYMAMTAMVLPYLHDLGSQRQGARPPPPQDGSRVNTPA